ncbi:MAG TPA: NDP-sugar synthase [Acidimicrobiales bacterium]
MRAVVLVGGEGTRLRPLTYSAPKQMLPIVGVTMIERVLGSLAAHGVDRAVLSLGYLPDVFVGAYPEGVAAGVRLSYAVEPEPYDTAGAVRFAAEYAQIDETFVVVNGDVLTDLDLGALVGFHQARGAEGTVALHPVADPSAFGVAVHDAQGRVTEFVEKPPRDRSPSNLINAGTYVLEPAVLARIAPGRRVSIERETFPAMVRDGTLYASADDAYWLDTGTPSAYLQAHRDLLAGRRGGIPSPGAVEHQPSIWTTGTPVIEGDVVAPSWLGDGASVAPGAVVSGSSLAAGCVVEQGASVVDSVLLAGARVAANASVAGSVLGPGSTVGERCDVRPISVLGAGAVVASGTMVDGKRVPA